MQDRLGSRLFRLWSMDKKAGTMLMKMAKEEKRIPKAAKEKTKTKTSRNKSKKQTDELKTLTKNIRQCDIVCTVIIRIQSQNASGESIHHILARRFHNDITHKTRRQGTVFTQQCTKAL